jgi:hypothetical protein
MLRQALVGCRFHEPRVISGSGHRVSSKKEQLCPDTRGAAERGRLMETAAAFEHENGP